MRIYEVAVQFGDIEAALHESGGELTEEIQKAMEGARANLEETADAYAALIVDNESEAERLRAEELRLAARRQAHTKTADRLRKEILEVMEGRGLGKLKTERFAISARKAGKRSVTVFMDAEKLPSLFRVVSYAPNKEALRKEMEDAGAEELRGIDGELFVRLEKPKLSLKIS